MCFTLFSDVTSFCFLGENMRWGCEFFICADAALVSPVCPRYPVTLFLPTSSNTSYSLSGIGRFDKILLCPREDGQEQRLSSASIKCLWLRQIHDPSGISPALDNALSTLLSCCSQHFFPVRVLASFIHPFSVVTLSDNDKQIAVNKSQRRQAFACRLF